jgi:hypothetical protein
VPRLEIVLSRKSGSRSRWGTERQFALGRLGSAVVTVLSAVVAIGLLTTVLLLGYVFIGVILAAMLVALLVAIGRSTWRALRR